MPPDDLQLAADLIRLKGVADHLLASARNATNSNLRKPVHSRARDLAQTIVKRLAAHPELADEFNSVVGNVEQTSELYWSTEAHCASIAGWLAGTIDGALLQARIQADAAAYAAERVKQERGVGFTAADG